MTTTKTVKATDLNLFTLTECVVRTAAAATLEADGSMLIPNAIESTDRNGMRRCIAAGLVEVASRTQLKLTAAAVEIVKARVRKTVNANNTFWPETLAKYTAAAAILGC